LVEFGDTRLPQRFWDKVEPEPNTGCWLWTAATNHAGYGMFWIGSKTDHTDRMTRAHRHAYKKLIGPLPDHICALHKCDVRPCVNPTHLWSGSRYQNARDMVSKNRSTRGERHGASKLTSHNVREIRRLRGVETQRKLADRFGVAQSTIASVQSGTAWVWLDYRPRMTRWDVEVPRGATKD